MGYHVTRGSTLDRARLVKFAQRTYRELYPDREFAHLADTVERYLNRNTPLWWVEAESDESGLPSSRQIVGCLWMGNAVDQVDGDRHAHIFLLYIDPQHRRRGLASTLVHQAETWAQQRGDRQMGLQVFAHNQAAIALYEKLGYRVLSHWMTKPLTDRRGDL